MSIKAWIISLICIISLPILAWFAGPVVAQEIAYQLEKGKNKAIREDIGVISQADSQSVLFNKVAEATKPAVVVVRVRKFANGRYKYSQASGVIVDAQRGHIITNYHVVAKADMVDVILHDQRIFRAQWFRGDKKTDLAVLKITADRLIACPFADSDAVKVGDCVLAVGAPLDLPQTITSGIISAKGRSTNPLMYQNYLQTDAAINRGNSGGPLLDTKGRVIGINTAIVSNSGMNGGIGMAIPANMVQNVLRQLINYGSVIRGYLGINYQPVSERMKEVYSLGDNTGAMITNVVIKSPASKAGLRAHDFLLSIDGREIKNTAELKNLIAMQTPGKQIKLTFIRDGRVLETHAIVGCLAEKNTGEDVCLTDFATQRERKIGLRVKTLTPDFGFPDHVKGVYVAGILRDGAAAYATPRPVEIGSVITHVGKRSVKNIQEFNRLISREIKELGGARLSLVSPRGIKYIVFVQAYR